MRVWSCWCALLRFSQGHTLTQVHRVHTKNTLNACVLLDAGSVWDVLWEFLRGCLWALGSCRPGSLSKTCAILAFSGTSGSRNGWCPPSSAPSIAGASCRRPAAASMLDPAPPPAPKAAHRGPTRRRRGGEPRVSLVSGSAARRGEGRVRTPRGNDPVMPAALQSHCLCPSTARRLSNCFFSRHEAGASQVPLASARPDVIQLQLRRIRGAAGSH